MQSHQPDGLAIKGLGHLTAHNDCLRIIYHRGAHVGVPEQFLNRTDVVAIFKQVRGNAFKPFDSFEPFESLERLSGPFKLLAFHRAVLQITDKVANHNRQPPGRFHNTVKRALADIPLIERHIKLRAHLATRTPGDVKNLNEFPVSSSLEALGNIRHN